jgi:peptidoglycan/LPS O-acetylase OafA/YrhL
MSKPISRQRYVELDGLRGLAAAAVFVWHFMLIDPWFSDSDAGAVLQETDNFKFWIFHSPLHLFFAGHEAVLIFFVLSGFVLSKSYSLPESLSYRYLLPRVVRLYLPILGALAFSLLLTYFWPSSPPPTLSTYHSNHLQGNTISEVFVNPSLFLGEMFLIPGQQFIDWPLWTMGVEITMSILLFIVLFLGRLRYFGLAIALMAAYLLKPVPQIEWLSTYVPFFVAGSLMAHLKISTNRLVGNLLLLFAIGSFSILWLSPVFMNRLEDNLIGKGLLLVGAVGIVFAVLKGTLFDKLLSGRIAQFLGTRSYSFYLVHSPIIIAIGFVFRSMFPMISYWYWLFIPIALVTLLCSEVFYRFIERPTLLYAKKMSLKFREAR